MIRTASPFAPSKSHSVCTCQRLLSACFFLSHLLVKPFQAVQIPLLMHAALNGQVLLSLLVAMVCCAVGLHANKANRGRGDCPAHQDCRACRGEGTRGNYRIVTYITPLCLLIVDINRFRLEQTRSSSDPSVVTAKFTAEEQEHIFIVVMLNTD